MATLRRRARHMDPCCGYRHRRLRVSPDTSSRRPDQRGGNEVGAVPVENRPKSLCGFNATGSPATVSWPNECNKDPRRSTKTSLMRPASAPQAFIKMGSRTNLAPVGNAAPLSHGGLIEDPKTCASGAGPSLAAPEFEVGRCPAVSEYEVSRAATAPDYEVGRATAAPQYEVAWVCASTTANKGN